ncbi:MAG: phage baseplate upper protein [Candidatus Pacebacteria bacterium]|nr:phage baseplate upper protein [Candidatus Paceibacterota bacterium]
MRTIIDITKDDKGYDLFFSLTDYNGEAVNLNGVSSILFKAQVPGESELKFSGEMNIIDSPGGEVKYTVQEGDFDEAGKYYAEIEATFEDGQLVTYGDIVINCKSDLPKAV